jgi:hypothetical protein
VVQLSCVIGVKRFRKQCRHPCRFFMQKRICSFCRACRWHSSLVPLPTSPRKHLLPSILHFLSSNFRRRKWNYQSMGYHRGCARTHISTCSSSKYPHRLQVAGVPSSLPQHPTWRSDTVLSMHRTDTCRELNCLDMNICGGDDYWFLAGSLYYTTSRNWEIRKYLQVLDSIPVEVECGHFNIIFALYFFLI